MKRQHWQVWTENDTILCEGSKVKCLRYYKKHGGCKAGLHFGYLVALDNN